MELRWSHIIRLYHVFREYDGKENCAQLIEEELYKMFDKASSNDEHDCNVASINSLNIHDSSDMQSHKLGDAMFDEDDIFIPPSFDVQICYNDSMPPIYYDYIDGSGFGEVIKYFLMNPLFWKRLQLTMITKLLSMMIMVMTCML